MAAITFQQMISRTINYLNQGYTNHPQKGTVTNIVTSGGAITTLTVKPVSGTNSHKGPALLEIDNSLIYATNYDSNSGTATVETWGNGYEGTAPLTALSTADLHSTEVTIDPIWSRWNVGLHLVDSINQMYPDLYSVKQVVLSSVTVAERYTMPADTGEVLKIQLEGYGPTRVRQPIRRWSFDPIAVDGTKYLSIRPVGLSGRPIVVWYRAQPVLPTGPNDFTWTWSSSQLPDSSSDLPVLHAAYTLLLEPESAKTQSYSAEQSDRNRLVQAGAGTAASRRIQELYKERLESEQEALSNKYPVRPHLTLNG